jgi:hypothetical protein
MHMHQLNLLSSQLLVSAAGYPDSDAIVAALGCGNLAVLRYSVKATRLVVVQRIPLATVPPPPGLGCRHAVSHPSSRAVIVVARLQQAAVFFAPECHPRGSKQIKRLHNEV